MSDNIETYPPTLSEVLELASIAEGKYGGMQPVYGPQQPTAVSRALGQISRATGFYKLLKTPELIVEGPHHPGNHKPTLAQAIALGL